MLKSPLFIALVVVSLVGVSSLVECGFLKDIIANHFEEHSVTQCPPEGTEVQYSLAKITLKQLNWKGSACGEQCQSMGLRSIPGTERAAMGPKLYCCCQSNEPKSHD